MCYMSGCLSGVPQSFASGKCGNLIDGLSVKYLILDKQKFTHREHYSTHQDRLINFFIRTEKAICH